MPFGLTVLKTVICAMKGIYQRTTSRSVTIVKSGCESLNHYTDYEAKANAGRIHLSETQFVILIADLIIPCREGTFARA